MKKIINVIILIISSLICLFAYNNKIKYVSIITPNILMEGNDYIFDSEDVNFSDDSMSSKNVQSAVNELKQAIADGCRVGYSKGTSSNGSYKCNKKTAGANQPFVFDSSNVKFDKNNGNLTSNNVKAAILEIAGKIPSCTSGYHVENETSSSYDCVTNRVPLEMATEALATSNFL